VRVKILSEYQIRMYLFVMAVVPLTDKTTSNINIFER